MKPVWRDNRGVTLIETLVAIAIFVLLLLMIDAVFSAARRGTAKAGLSADVQQNVRIAVDRLTREMRETSTSNVAIGGTPGARAVVFKSARPKGSPTVFCVNTTTAPLYNASCFTSPGPTGATVAEFAPFWQSFVGYRVVTAAGGGYDLERYVCDLSSDSDPLPPDPASPPGGCTIQTIATFIESFDLSPVPLTGNRLTVVLKGTGQETVQGSPLPPQEILVEGTVVLRN